LVRPIDEESGDEILSHAHGVVNHHDPAALLEFDAVLDQAGQRGDGQEDAAPPLCRRPVAVDSHDRDHGGNVAHDAAEGHQGGHKLQGGQRQKSTDGNHARQGEEEPVHQQYTDAHSRVLLQILAALLSFRQLHG